MDQFHLEIEKKQRFEFGKNWKRFLSVLNENRIRSAENSLAEMLGVQSLKGKRFLDAGSGSGLFSLAARRLGAEVVSFDFDPTSVECTETLKTRFFPNDSNWTIHRGSVLDLAFLDSLGKFDVIYSWGVLHHTGDMWGALENILIPTKPRSQLFIAIYNDQGWLSKLWLFIKKFYCFNSITKYLVLSFMVPYFVSRTLIKSCLTRKNEFSAYYKNNNRGMSIFYDWLDWLGGLPFEVASENAISDFYKSKKLSLTNIKKTKSFGNNQFVFVRNEP